MALISDNNMLKKIYETIFLTYNNSLDLYESAEILFEKGKINSSYTFYHFSFEEGGRFFLLLKVLFQYLQGDISKKELNYGYLKKIGFERHTKKLDESVLKLFALPIYESVINNNTEQTDKLIEIHEFISSRVNVFNVLKNKSIYICYEDNSFISPSESISQEDLEYMKELADIQLINIKIFLEKIKKEGKLEELKGIFKIKNK